MYTPLRTLNIKDSIRPRDIILQLLQRFQTESIQQIDILVLHSHPERNLLTMVNLNLFARTSLVAGISALLLVGETANAQFTKRKLNLFKLVW